MKTGQNTSRRRKAKSKPQKSKQLTHNDMIVKVPKGKIDVLEDFIADIWKVMTPEMFGYLENLLVRDMGISKGESEGIIKNLKDIGSQKSCFESRHEENRIVRVGPRNLWIKEISKNIADQLATFIVGALLSPSTDRTRRLTEIILEHLCKLTEENVTVGSATTRIERAMIVAADSMAKWINGALSGIEERTKCICDVKYRPSTPECTAVSRVMSESDDELSESEYPPYPFYLYMPVCLNSTSPDQTYPPKSQEVTEQLTGTRPQIGKVSSHTKRMSKEKKEEGEENEGEKDEEEEGEEEKEVETDEEEDEEVENVEEEFDDSDEAEDDDDSINLSQDSEKDSTVSKNKSIESDSETEGSENTTEPEDSEDNRSEDGKKQKRVSKEKDAEKVTGNDTGKRDTNVSEGDEIGEGSGEVDELSIDQKDSEEYKTPPRSPSIIPLKSTSLEQSSHKDIKDIFDLLKEDMERVSKGKPVSTRQKAVKDNIYERFRNIAEEKNESSLDTLMRNDISEVASIAANWIESVLPAEESSQTPFVRRSSAFEIKQYGSKYKALKLSYTTVAQKVADLKGVDLQTRKARPIPQTMSPLNSKSRNDWADWALGAANVGSDWGRWLDRNISQMEQRLNDKQPKASKDKYQSWQGWRSKAEQEALTWREENKRLRQEGDLWKRKLLRKSSNDSETEIKTVNY